MNIFAINIHRIFNVFFSTVHFKNKPFSCEYCQQMFGRKDKAKRHVAVVHFGEKPFRCNYCSHKTSRRDKMRAHLAQVWYHLESFMGREQLIKSSFPYVYAIEFTAHYLLFRFIPKMALNFTNFRAKRLVM